MGKEPNSNQKHVKAPEEMSEAEMIYRIIHIFTQPGITIAKRLEMLEAIERIAARPDKDSN